MENSMFGTSHHADSLLTSEEINEKIARAADKIKKQSIVNLSHIFPYGHPDFIPGLIDIMELHSNKNYAYAHGGDPLGNFDRRDKIMALYPGLETRKSPAVTPLVDMLKQLDAALWQLSQGYEDDIEGIDQRLRDVIGYTEIARIRLKEARDAETPSGD